MSRGILTLSISVSPRGARWLLPALLLGVSPRALDSESLRLQMSYPAAVAAYAELRVEGSANLNTSGAGGVGVGVLSSQTPAIANGMNVVKTGFMPNDAISTFGSNTALNSSSMGGGSWAIFSGNGSGVDGGVSFESRSSSSERWAMYPNAGEFRFSKISSGTVAVDWTGGLKICKWQQATVCSAPYNITMFNGTGSSDNVTYDCSNNGTATCMPPGGNSWRLCCAIECPAGVCT